MYNIATCIVGGVVSSPEILLYSILYYIAGAEQVFSLLLSMSVLCSKKKNNIIFEFSGIQYITEIYPQVNLSTD